MTAETLRLSAADRVLVLAPHPDDESIACGGLLLAARDAGAARRVLVVTDGDNNPWPQRWIEKRWKIDDSARARWGSRRRAEAQAALDVLGVDAAQRFFFGLPDSTLTALLMRDSPDLIGQLREHIAAFQPTLIALPVLEDRHPDHSALHIAALLAMIDRPALEPRCLGFSVHGEVAAAKRIEIPLSAAQESDKARAIVQHETQMRLSRKRFIAFARGPELYRSHTTPAEPRSPHPLRGRIDGTALQLQFDTTDLQGKPAAYHVLLLIALQNGTLLHRRIPMTKSAADSRLGQSIGEGDIASQTAWRRTGAALLELHLALDPAAVPVSAFAKLVRNRPGLVIYDRYGWQNLRVDSPDLGNS